MRLNLAYPWNPEVDVLSGLPFPGDVLNCDSCNIGGEENDEVDLHNANPGSAEADSFVVVCVVVNGIHC